MANDPQKQQDDAADVSFATMFGSVLGGAPIMSIRSVVDAERGLTEPVRTNQAVSTAGAVLHSPALHLVSPSPAPALVGNDARFGRQYA